MLKKASKYEINSVKVVYLHVAADWADIFDTPTKQEKTYLKPRCTPFPGNMSFNPETIAKCCATWPWSQSERQLFL